MTQTTIGEALYIEDRQTLVEIAQSFGITSLQYKDVASTEKYMKQAGF
jgi:predicted DsbA family dithiol-disulfide isomerase